MKIKYLETKEIKRETTLLDILNLEDKFNKKTIKTIKGTVEIEITFWSNRKTITLLIEELGISSRFDTSKLSPETINGVIKSMTNLIEGKERKKYEE